MSDTLQMIKDAVITRQRAEIQKLVKAAVDDGLDPNSIINDGLIPAMDEVGRQFGEGEIFVPEMLVSAMTMKLGLELVKPLLSGKEAQSRGTIIMATVKGDLHDIGKNIVIMMLEGAGFNVVDLGVDMAVETIIEKIKIIMPDILGLSALLTTTMPEMERAIQELRAKGLREKVKVMIGGAPVNKSFAEKIKADGHGADATEAVKLARRLIGTYKKI